MEENELNTYLESKVAYAKALKNGIVYASSEGKKTVKISELGLTPDKLKYKQTKGIRKNDGLEFEISQFEIELPNGERTIVTLGSNGHSMSCDFVDENDKSQKFLLTPEMKKKITQNIDGKIAGTSKELYESTLFPNSQDELEKEIGKDTLIPKNSEEAVKKIKELYPNADIKETVEKKQNDKETSRVDEKDGSEREVDKEDKEDREETKDDKEEEIGLPKEIKDVVTRIKEENGDSLKHVLISKNPQSVADQLQETTGINENGEPVYVLAFRSGGDLSTTNDRIILVQGNNVIDERKNDEVGSQIMSQYRNSNVVENADDKETKVYYTDIDGNTHSSTMQASPRDLTQVEKEKLEEELVKIDSKEKEIQSADMPPDKKIDLLNKVNEERLNTLDEYGVIGDGVRGEIKTDNKTLENERKKVEENKEKMQEEKENEEEEEEEDKEEPKSEEEKESDYDERDPMFKRLFGKQ